MEQNSKFLFWVFTIICSSSKGLQHRSCLPSNVSRAEKKFRTRLNSEVFASKDKSVKLQYLEFPPETDEYDNDILKQVLLIS